MISQGPAGGRSELCLRHGCYRHGWLGSESHPGLVNWSTSREHSRLAKDLDVGTRSSQTELQGQGEATTARRHHSVTPSQE